MIKLQSFAFPNTPESNESFALNKSIKLFYVKKVCLALLSQSQILFIKI